MGRILFFFLAAANVVPQISVADSGPRTGQVTQVPVGSVIRRSIRLDRMASGRANLVPRIDPPGAAIAHVDLGVPSLLTIVFLRQGPVRIAFSTDSGEFGTVAGTPFRFDVRPWATLPNLQRGAIRAGVGAFEGSLSAHRTQAKAGEAVAITLQCRGDASLAMTDPPDLRIQQELPERSHIDTNLRADLSERSIDYGDGVDRQATVTWTYEWLPAVAGRFRVEPLRIMHADEQARVQSRLIAGLTIDITARLIYREDDDALARLSTIDADSRSGGRLPLWTLVLLAGIVGSTSILVLERRQGWLFRACLCWATYRVRTPDEAIGALRAFDRGRTRWSHRMTATDRSRYERLLRTAFGKRAETPSEIFVGSVQKPMR
jgi:predicted component of type VI protein secretion system